MNLSESPRTAARFAAAVFVIGGLAGAITGQFVLHQPRVAYLFSALDVAAGIVAWFLPWDRWPSKATFALVLVGFALISGSRASGLDPSASFVASFVLAFMFVGVTQPPGASYLLAAPAVVAYVLPALVSTHYDSADIQSLGIVLPMLIVAGEVPARMVAELRRARAAEHEYALQCATEAATDVLTGLGNRRSGERLLAQLEPGDGVLLMDLDHFKAVNDRFGHAGGDRVLRDLGAYLRAAVRGEDAVARFGGEEFLVVLRHPSEAAVDVAKRLVEGWRALSPVTTLSIGVAVHDSAHSISTTYGQADTALYRAKKNGRDQVEMFGAGDVVMEHETPAAGVGLS